MNDEKSDYTQFANEIAEFEASQQKARKEQIENKFHYQGKTENTAKNLHPFSFNPNGLSEKKWKEIGLSVYQIKVIKNYEEKGGRFYRKEDLARIYSISEEEYKVLEPYIQIEKEAKGETKELVVSTEIIPFPFDPNTLEEEEWLKMGLREKLINTILNYRDKGGKFYKKDDLKRIYGMKPEEFAILEPFVNIETDTVRISYISRKDTVIVEINSADTLDLQQLKGIGPSFARRIVKYRDMLGGYYSKTQLLEVYGMDSVRYIGIRDFVDVNPESIEKIDINSATIKQLIRHPYIEFYTAKSIVKYRQTVGKYSGVSQLKDSVLIYDELYQKIAPYLIAK